MVKIESLELKIGNISLINQFLINAGRSLETFRYFEKRSLESINSHLITYVLIKEMQVIGYGHLERENEKVWLGIAIVESQMGMGYGLYMMDSLLDFARKQQIGQVHLSADKVNIGAIKLYEKVGFINIEELSEKAFLMKKEL